MPVWGHGAESNWPLFSRGSQAGRETGTQTMTQNKGLQGREKLGTNGVYLSRRHGSFLTEEGEKT